jgi:NitT/TauT family transport system substrate-binding protein
MVLVPQKWIDTNPKAVQAFVTATIEGWRNYLHGNPAPANAIIRHDNPEMTDGLIAQAIAKMNAYHLAETQDGALGTMADARWKTFFDTMASEGLYPKTLDYRKAYDLRFIGGTWVKKAVRIYNLPAQAK